MDRQVYLIKLFTAFAALFFLSAIVFAQTAGHDFLNMDDPIYVTDNPNVRAGLTWRGISWALTATEAANWHPLTWISHLMDISLFGRRPAGHHAVNVLLHSLNAMLLFLLLYCLTAAMPPSFLTAAFFAVHPSQAETVAWISQRKGLLALTCILLSLLVWRRFLARPSKKLYMAAVLPFALALMAKPIAVSMPFILLALDFWPLGRWGHPAGTASARRRFGYAVVEKLPFFALSLAAALLSFRTQVSAGAVGLMEPHHLPARLGNAMVSAAAYWRQIVMPAGLSYFYPPSPLSAAAAVPAAVLLLGMTLVVVLRRHRAPYLAAGWLWYLFGLGPVLGLVQVGLQARADRYLYLSLAGPLIMIFWGAIKAAPGRGRLLAAIVAAPSLVIFSWMGFQAAAFWKDNLSLYGRAAAVDPLNIKARYDLGRALLDAGRLEEAQDDFSYILTRIPMADATAGLADISSRRGDAEQAKALFREALAMDASNRNAKRGLADLLAKSGGQDEAEALYRQLLAAEPHNARVRNNLGAVLAGTGRLAEAREHFRAAVDHDPFYALARLNLGRTLAADDGRAAAVQLREALRLDPGLAEARQMLEGLKP